MRKSRAVEQISDSVRIMPPFNADNAASFAVVKDSDLYVWWVTQQPTYGSGDMNSIYYASNSGSGWSAPVEWHTEAASNGTQDWFHNPSVTLAGDGSWLVVVDRIYRTGGGNAWSVSGFIGTPATPPVTSLPYSYLGTSLGGFTGSGGFSLLT